MNRNEANEWIDNEIGAEGAGMIISEALKYNSTLIELNLRGNDGHEIDYAIGIWGNDN